MSTMDISSTAYQRKFLASSLSPALPFSPIRSMGTVGDQVVPDLPLQSPGWVRERTKHLMLMVLGVHKAYQAQVTKNVLLFFFLP